MIARKPLLFSAFFLLATLLILISRSLNASPAALSLPHVDLFKNLDIELPKWRTASTHDPDTDYHEAHRPPPPSSWSSSWSDAPDSESSSSASIVSSAGPSSDSTNSLTVTDLNPGNHSQIHSRARVGMVTMVLGKTNPTYERAQRTHQVHAQRHGCPLFTLRKEILDIMYNKPMYVLDLLFQEMKKPDHERMEWFLYVASPFPLFNRCPPYPLGES